MSEPKVKESGADIVDTFLELIQALLREPEARQNFFAVTSGTHSCSLFVVETTINY